MITQNTGVKHDSLQITPFVGMTGLYSLKAPYDVLIDPTIEYTCISVTNISGLLAQGKDPKKDIYLSSGDTEANYLIDYNLNRSVISIQSGIGKIITVPVSCLNKLPDSDGINYFNMMLGISLSILPDNTDLEPIKLEIENLIFKRLGITSKCFHTLMGGSLTLPHSTHDSIQTARLANVDNSSNPVLENDRLKQTNSALTTKINLLENYVKNNL